LNKLNDIEILVVEDSPSDAELTMRALKQQKLTNKLHWVKDGEEALEFIFATGAYSDRSLNSKPKIILLDLKLPKVDGLEVLRKVRADPRTNTIPIVVLTSSNEDRDRVESYKLGVNSYIQKPVDFDGFIKSVSDIGLYWLLLNKPPL